MQEQLEALHQQTDTLRRAGKYADATEAALRALGLSEKEFGPDHPNTGTCVNNLAVLYSEQGQKEKAEPLYLRALAIKEKAMGQDHPETGTSVGNLARLYYLQGQYPQAEPLALRALAIHEKALGPDHPTTGISVNNLAYLYSQQAQYAKAEPLYLRALGINEQALGRDHPDTGITVTNLAVFYQRQGQYPKAEALHLRAVAIHEKALGPDHPTTGTSVNNLASLYVDQGQYAKAELLYLRALAILEKALGPDHPNTGVSVFGLAALYSKQGNYAKAEPLYLRAIAIHEKALGPDHLITAWSVEGLALLHSAQGQSANAEPLLLRGLAINEKALGPDHPNTATSVNNLASLYSEQAQYAKAEPLLLRALAIHEKALGPDHPDTAASVNNLAFLYIELGQYAKAEPLLLRALAINEKALGPDHPNTATPVFNLASLYSKQAQYAKAEPLFLRSLSIHEKVLGLDHPVTRNSVTNLTALYLDWQRVSQARATIANTWQRRLSAFERLARFGRTSLQRKRVADLQAEIELLIASMDSDQTARQHAMQGVVSAKARTGDETIIALQSLRPRLEQDVQAKLYELDATQDELTALENHRNGTGHERKAALEEQEDRLVADLTERSLEFREITATPSVTQVRKQVGPRAAVVELLRYREVYSPERNGQRWGPPRYGAFLAAATGPIHWVDLGSAGLIDTYIRRFRAAVASPANRAVATHAARAIRRAVVDPIRNAMPDIAEWYIAPDGLLRLVPLGALPEDAPSGRPVLATLRIHMLGTSRDLMTGVPMRSVQPAWVGGLDAFGTAADGGPFHPIPNAKEEADSVAAIIRPKPQLLAPSQMTREFFLEKLNAPRILHLATHGSYTDEAGGRLALKDANLSPRNVLTQHDIAKLRLFGTQLVVLSACESGLGEVNFADGLIGMQRSLTVAGSRSQILTAWPVDDSKTRDLMIKFYSNLFEKGMPKNEALRQAQLAMADEGLHMYYWGAFILYGDGGRLGQ